MNTSRIKFLITARITRQQHGLRVAIENQWRKFQIDTYNCAKDIELFSKQCNNTLLLASVFWELKG